MILDSKSGMLVKARAVSTLIFRFHGNGFLFQYSTAGAAIPNTDFIVNYLINSLGFSKEEAICSSAKLTHRVSFKNPDFTSAKVTHRVFFNNPDFTVKFFKQRGFNDTQIKTLVSKCPDLLFYDVEKTLKPKLQCLSELGLSGPDLAKILLRDWTFVNRGLDTHIRPIINCLRNVVGSDENVAKVIKKGYWLISFRCCGILEDNLNLLRSFGCSNDLIKNIVLKNPKFLNIPTKKLEEMLPRVEKEVGMSRDSVLFYQVVYELTCAKPSTIETKMEIFKSFGWSNSDICTMLQRHPQCIGLSEAKLQTALTFFMKELRYKSTYVASRPSLLAYSLEKRVKPRYKIWKFVNEKKLTKNKMEFYATVTWPESKFLEKFVLPFKAEVPDLYDLYIKSIGE